MADLSMIPDFPTETIRVDELLPGDQVIVPMVGNIETVLHCEDGLVSTTGTGSSSAYMWRGSDSIDVVNRTTATQPPAGER